VEVTVVEAESNRPLAGAEAMTPGEAIPESCVGRTDAQGVARLRLAAGEYGQVSARLPHEYAPSESEEVLEVAEGKIVKVTVSLDQRLSRHHGVVRDASGRPLAGVVITGPSFSGRCDYRLTNAAGEYVLLDPTGGDVQTAVLFRDPARNLVSTAVLDDANAHGEVTMGAGGIVRGRVVDESNKPVPAASVNVWRSEGDEGGVDSSLEVTSGVVVDGEGRYEARALLPGKYTLTARASGYGEASAEVEIPSDPNEMKESVSADELKLPLADLTVTGVVVDDKGKPVPGATVDVTGDGQSSRNSLTADDAGRFTIRKLVKGVVTVSAEKGEQSGSSDVEASTKDVRVQIHDQSP